MVVLVVVELVALLEEQAVTMVAGLVVRARQGILAVVVPVAVVTMAVAVAVWMTAPIIKAVVVVALAM